jgi:hypothetical protein
MAVKLFSSGNRQQFVDCNADLSAGYHTYSMEYQQGSSIKIFFDGSNVYTYTRNVPVGPYFMILSTASHRRVRPAGTPRSATQRRPST